MIGALFQLFNNKKPVKKSQEPDTNKLLGDIWAIQEEKIEIKRRIFKEKLRRKLIKNAYKRAFNDIEKYPNAIAWGYASCEDFDQVDWYAITTEGDLIDFSQPQYQHGTFQLVQYQFNTTVIFQKQDALKQYANDIILALLNKHDFGGYDVWSGHYMSIWDCHDRPYISESDLWEMRCNDANF